MRALCGWLRWWWFGSRQVARVLHPRREMHARMDLIESDVLQLNRKLSFIVTAMAEVVNDADSLSEPEGLPVRACFGGKPAPAPRERHGLQVKPGAGEASGPRRAELSVVSGSAR